ncbi:uncharacterized protein LOC127287551 [Leptopilina boulardi]|uniref:uncharacterized protein LOC127287551 n=1 Tax=Leptopilina boulardi TaxID=63433 RepID=UPI0021F5D125|nr:uncharacterized protein LOC127287551 [Leptopilina boulardi]
MYHETFFRYFATGDLILSVSLAFRIGESTARNIIKEVSQALTQVLSPIYLKAPDTNRWLQISADFLQNCNFPNTAGPFDGKHFEIKCPSNSGSSYYNYKKNFSVVLIAACDSNYKFTVIHVGEMGGNNDSGIFAQSPIRLSLHNNQIGLPNGTAALPGSEERIPMVFLGDGGFPNWPHLMVPYSGKHVNENRRIFNYRLCRARRLIENAFGILTARWRIFRRASELLVDSFDSVILATICLHNFLKTRDEEQN